MTLDDLKELLEELDSNYRITTDKRGKIIIHTNLVEDSDGDLVPADEVEEMDFASDEDDEDEEELDSYEEFDEDDE